MQCSSVLLYGCLPAPCSTEGSLRASAHVPTAHSWAGQRLRLFGAGRISVVAAGGVATPLLRVSLAAGLRHSGHRNTPSPRAPAPGCRSCEWERRIHDLRQLPSRICAPHPCSNGRRRSRRQQRLGRTARHRSFRGSCRGRGSWPASGGGQRSWNSFCTAPLTEKRSTWVLYIHMEATEQAP
jgi:hypothetical protein